MGPLGGVGDSGPCSVIFVHLGNKEFYIDQPEVEEFDVQLSHKGVENWRVESEVEELRTNHTDVKL